MELYITGDTHGDFSRFRPESFYEQERLTKEDVILVAGDFGGVWYGDSRDDAGLNFLDSRPFTTAFVSGNHENYDALAAYPQAEWYGGRVRTIRPSVLMLERGQVFDLGGRTFFTMGGASSHDIQDGILEPDAPDFLRLFQQLNAQGSAFRVNHRSWWREELPSEAEYAQARASLDQAGWTVDTSSPTALPPASRTTCWGRCPSQMPSQTFWRRSASGASSSITSSDIIMETRSSEKNMCYCTSRSYG